MAQADSPIAWSEEAFERFLGWLASLYPSWGGWPFPPRTKAAWYDALGALEPRDVAAGVWRVGEEAPSQFPPSLPQVVAAARAVAARRRERERAAADLERMRAEDEALGVPLYRWSRDGESEEQRAQVARIDTRRRGAP